MVLLLLPVASAQAKRNVYVVGNSSNDVAALDIDGFGFLTPVSGSPFAAGESAVSVAMSPDGRHAYVTNAEAPTGVSAYGVNAAGGLTPIAGAFPVGSVPLGNAVTPNGRFMYVNNRTSSDVTAFQIEPSGALTAVSGSPFAVGGEPTGIALSSDGRFLYTANQEGTVSASSIAADGTLSPVAGSPFAAGLNTWAAAVTPDGRFLYAVNNESDDISAYAIAADGSLAPLAGPPIASGGLQPNGIAMAPDGRHLYTMSSTGIGGFEIAASGALSAVPGSPVAAANTRSGALTPDGSRLYVAAFGGGAHDSVLGFSVGANGSLSELGGSPFDSGIDIPDVQALAITPNQGPLASFTSSPREAGSPSAFDGKASSDPDGTVARYDWDFDDGASLPNGGPTASHVYAKPGTYTVTLTVTDNEGCSTAVVFTGQTASCNGSEAARAKASLVVPPDPKPKLMLFGKKSQKLGRSVLVKARTDEKATLVASGRLIVTTPRNQGAEASARKSFKLKQRTRRVAADRTVTLKLKLSKAARNAAASALENGGRVKAKLKVFATDRAGNRTRKTRTIKLHD